MVAAKFVSSGVSMLGISSYISTCTQLSTYDSQILRMLCALQMYSMMNFKSISWNSLYRDR